MFVFRFDTPHNHKILFLCNLYFLKLERSFRQLCVRLHVRLSVTVYILT